MANQNKPVYNPSIPYAWNPDANIILTGQEYASFYHLLNREMNEAGGAPLSLKVEAFNVLMVVFRRGIELGIIVPQDEYQGVLDEQDQSNVKSLFDHNKQ